MIALPMMESFGFQRFAKAADPAASPKRMAFLAMGWGVTKESWYPDQKTTGTDYTLPPGLAPLKRHQEDITVIQNLANQFNNEAHWGSTFYLTGANRYAEPGQSFHNTISVDQVAAEQFGQETRFTSIQLGCKGASGDGHGPGLSLSWDKRGKPIAGLDTPIAAFHRLFASDDTPMEQQQATLTKRRSILDTVMEDARSVSKGLSSNDVDKLDEYMQSIRDIEVRIAKEEDWLEVPKKQPTQELKEPNAKVQGFEEVKIMHDLMVAAMQVDASRVFTYRQPVHTFIQSLGATISGHNMSHYDQGARREVSEMRDQKNSELLARLIDKLKNSKEPDGSSLFDHVNLTFGSNIHSVHHLVNCPTVVTGGGAGFVHGRHLVMDDPKTPLCNLWLTQLRGLGIEAESHGDSNGTIDELFVA